jgi:hypothetical protein
MVSLEDIIRMLEKCAPGYHIVEKTHNLQVYWNKKIYHGLPKYDRMPPGHVRSMARMLEILDCAKSVLGI